MATDHADQMREAIAREFREGRDALPNHLLDSLSPSQAEHLCVKRLS